MNDIVLLGLVSIFIAGLVTGEIPFTQMHLFKHQCDVDGPNGNGDPNCYNYKTRNGELYDVPTSAKIAERSGGDMNRFADYHCGNNFRSTNGDKYCKSIGRRTLFE